MEVEGVYRIFLFVSDLPRSRNFYATILGEHDHDDDDDDHDHHGHGHHDDHVAEVDDHDGEGHAEFRIGRVSLFLHSDAEADWLPAGVPRGVGTAFHLRVHDIDEQYERLKAAGFETETPQLLHTRIRKIALKDPDGYELELVELPH